MGDVIQINAANRTYGVVKATQVNHADLTPEERKAVEEALKRQEFEGRRTIELNEAKVRALVSVISGKCSLAATHLKTIAAYAGVKSHPAMGRLHEIQKQLTWIIADFDGVPSEDEPA